MVATGAIIAIAKRSEAAESRILRMSSSFCSSVNYLMTLGLVGQPHKLDAFRFAIDVQIPSSRLLPSTDIRVFEIVFFT